MNGTWTALIPIKAWTKAKTRLKLAEGARAAFARAVALDTLDTVAASPMIGRIVVIGPEAELAEVTASLPEAVVLGEPPGESSDQLNDAIRLARDWALTHVPTCPVVVIPADLPALGTDSLDGALQQLAWFDRAHIPDHRGKGTTLSAAVRPDLLTPRYGLASERAHAAVGSVPILDVALGARLDVDNLEDLARATSLGLGPRTGAIRYALQYAEGYPGHRYYGGCEHVDVIEQLAIDRVEDGAAVVTLIDLRDVGSAVVARRLAARCGPAALARDVRGQAGAPSDARP